MSSRTPQEIDALAREAQDAAHGCSYEYQKLLEQLAAVLRDLSAAHERLREACVVKSPIHDETWSCSVCDLGWRGERWPGVHMPTFPLKGDAP